MVMIKFGIILFQTAGSVRVTEAAIAAESAGFESIWVTEHSHIPTTSKFYLPEVPMMYKSILDPIVVLSAAAAVTSGIRLGTGIAIVPQHDPIYLAKQVASLDVQSHGRVLLGVGGGWNEPEMVHHGTDPAHRFAILREKVLAMKALWTDEVAEFHGRFVDFGPSWAWPKPVQSPHPPIIIGGNGPNALKRVVAYADGWFPLALSWPNEWLAERVVQLSRLAEEAGRLRPEVTLGGHPTDREADLPSDEASLAALQDVGVDRVIWNLQDANRESALRRIEELGVAIKSFQTSSA